MSIYDKVIYNTNNRPRDKEAHFYKSGLRSSRGTQLDWLSNCKVYDQMWNKGCYDLMGGGESVLFTFAKQHLHSLLF